jgi:hypothetical protein
MRGTLMNKDTTEAITTTEREFTASEEGYIDLEFTVDSVAGQHMVAFEKLYTEAETEQGVQEVEIASHEDLNDADQTVTVGVPGIKTVALDSISGKHTGTSSKKSVVKDTVTCTGLTAGTEYTLEADIYDAASGNKISSKSVSHKFTPSASNGSEVVSIEVNTSDFDDKRKSAKIGNLLTKMRKAGVIITAEKKRWKLTDDFKRTLSENK